MLNNLCQWLQAYPEYKLVIANFSLVAINFILACATIAYSTAVFITIKKRTKTEKLDRAVRYYEVFNEKIFSEYSEFIRDIRTTLGDKPKEIDFTANKSKEFLDHRKSQIFKYLNWIDALGYLDKEKRIDSEFITVNLGFFIMDVYDYCWEYVHKKYLKQINVSWMFIEDYVAQVKKRYDKYKKNGVYILDKPKII